MKDFHLAVKNAHQSLVKQASQTTDVSICGIKKMGNLANTSSPGPVCRAVREVESGLQTALSIFCHEELGSTGCWGCAAKVLSAATHCIGRDIEACVKDVIGAGSNCYSCVCEFISC